MNRENLFEVDNGINVNDKFIIYISNSLEEVNDKREGDFCIVDNKIFKFKNNKWVEYIDKEEAKKLINRYAL